MTASAFTNFTCVNAKRDVQTHIWQWECRIFSAVCKLKFWRYDDLKQTVVYSGIGTRGCCMPLSTEGATWHSLVCHTIQEPVKADMARRIQYGTNFTSMNLTPRLPTLRFAFLPPAGPAHCPVPTATVRRLARARDHRAIQEVGLTVSIGGEWRGGTVELFAAGACNRWCNRIGPCDVARWIEAYLFDLTLGRSTVIFQDRSKKRRYKSHPSWMQWSRATHCTALPPEKSSLVMFCHSRWLLWLIFTTPALMHKVISKGPRSVLRRGKLRLEQLP